MSFVKDPKPRAREIILGILVFALIGIISIAFYIYDARQDKAASGEPACSTDAEYADCTAVSGGAYSLSVPEESDVRFVSLSVIDGSMNIELLLKDGHDHDVDSYCYVLSGGLYCDCEYYVGKADAEGFRPIKVSCSAFDLPTSHPERLEIIFFPCNEDGDLYCAHGVMIYGLDYQFDDPEE